MSATTTIAEANDDRPAGIAELRTLAREKFGWAELHPEQERAVGALLHGQDVLAVMPTGWGKSAIYQLAGLLLDGPTVVLSPLIALQSDQIRSIAESDAPDAVAVNSQVGAAGVERSWQELRSGAAEFVFLTPEQLSNPEVCERLAEAKPSLLVVDEAHCVSSWGHDFRPDYLRVGDALEPIGRPRVLAMTATASPPVRAEIVERLRMSSPRQIVGGFDRPNLYLSVQQFADEHAKQQAVLDAVAGYPLPGLVYVGKRKDAETYADRLRERGLNARAFHAGMRAKDRERVHGGFLRGEIDVVVATSAFGMGIDKPDVRFVVHAHVSESIDAYYQEVGRAGRDGEPAAAQLMYRSQDLGLRRFFASSGFDAVTVRRIASALLEGPGRIRDVESRLGIKHRRAVSAVSLLERAGALTVTADGLAEWTGQVSSARDAAEAAERVADAIVSIGRSRLEMMRGYAETTGCRRQFLLGYFGQDLPQPCGHCDTCEKAAVGDTASEPQDRRGTPGSDDTAGSSGASGSGDATEPLPYPVNAQVRHRTWGHGVVMHPEPDRITVLFDEVGYKTLSLELLEREPLLDLED